MKKKAKETAITILASPKSGKDGDGEDEVSEKALAVEEFADALADDDYESAAEALEAFMAMCGD